ncbi:ferrous iron transporter B [Anaerosalibacter massiliensis]|mgnify:CR=1 FL=1|uniref:Ferrous iron transporter B n=1 Tax=Anaerosalibacter massiliensis TaxID=1347392 RepID=A0A9X2MJ44_9FIRM|nr:ferrous iron transporter B [Anaerosalibacter massiliensis]MCR2044664.1 ferrous iron transporter B [Anaerosalibacter massiliensis]
MSIGSDTIYDDTIENAIKGIEASLEKDYIISKRALSLLLLQEDEDSLEEIKEREKENYLKIISIVEETKNKYERPLTFVISSYRQKYAKTLTDNVMVKTETNKKSFSETLDKIMLNPITGVPIALLVLYFGLYKFVGQFGAGVIVDFLEGNIFEAYINPWINNILNNYVSWEWLRTLIGGDYGIITLGIRYAIAIVLPIVGTFFFVFSIIEDSGYLPRLAMLVDRLFKKIGLNGRAVIPMVLGFGCDTMATMVSRTLETERERIISTLLLALAIPCSAQLGVILSLLSGEPKALLVWLIFIVVVFLFIGYLAAKVLPGEEPLFYMEMPPLRLPKLSNVLVKTYTRMEWYFAEVLPLFILISVFIWFGNIIGIFSVLVNIFRPFVTAIGLPEEVSEIFLFGFFRRDYGAAGLFDLVKGGILSARQLVVASATLTLFVPCVAQFVMMIKERGLKTAIYIAAFVFVFSFFAGYALNWILITTGALV